MESFVYPDIHDNYQYLPWFYSQSNTHGKNLWFGTGWSIYYYNEYYAPGYERFVWAQFLAARFGTSILKDIWSQMATEPFLESLRDVLVRYGSTFPDEFALFAYWNYFTADRADELQYYRQGSEYPRLSPKDSIFYLHATSSMTTTVYPFSLSMHNFIDTTSGQTDTITAILVNADLAAAVNRDASTRSAELMVSNCSLSVPHQTFSNGVTIGFTADDNSLWRIWYLGSSTKSAIANISSSPAPNPLKLKEASRLLLPVPKETAATAHVTFLSSSLSGSFSGSYPISTEFGKNTVVVPTSDLRSHLASGMYLVVATVSGNRYLWKVAVIQ
jgi:hypothetical protein